MIVKVTMEIEGRVALEIEAVEDGWRITGDMLRGHTGETTIIDREGHRAMAEIVRHFGALESRYAIERALRERDAASSWKT